MTFGMAIVIVLLIVLIFFGFLSGISNPVPWIALAILIVLIITNIRLTSTRYLTWKDSYSVGIESIDNDHKKLIHLINNLQTAIDYKTDRQFEIQTMDEVIDYTHYHFDREEGLMEDNGYPGFVAHKAKHKEMIAKVNEYVLEFETDEEDSIQSLLAYLKSWLIKHINGTDQEYSEFLISKGVK
jgi:hemerythrin